MLPTLPSGSLVLTVRRQRKHLKVGHCVVIEVEHKKRIIKRIMALENKGLRLRSDNRTTRSCYCRYPHEYQAVVGQLLMVLYRPKSKRQEQGSKPTNDGNGSEPD